jgi:nitrogen fixation NifU-like protein
LTVEDDVISSMVYQAEGCRNTHACANAIIHLAEKFPIGRAWEITPEQVVDFLGTLPESEIHCAEVAAGALYRALSDYEKKHP